MPPWVAQVGMGAGSRTQPSCCLSRCLATSLELPPCLLQFLICLGCVCVLFPESADTAACHSWPAWGVPDEVWFITIFDWFVKGLGDVVAWTAGTVLGDLAGLSQSRVPV